MPNPFTQEGRRKRGRPPAPAKTRILTPRELERVRQLISVNQPLTIQEEDVALDELGLVQVYERRTIDSAPRPLSLEWKHVCKVADSMGIPPEQARWLPGVGVTVVAAPDARERFYTESGGVRKVWWYVKGRTFAKYAAEA